jgi:thymidylate synthase ThyX
MGVDLLYATREAAPRNVYPYPNIFKNPKNQNLVRGLRKTEKLVDGSKLISLDILITPELKKKLVNLERKKKETFSSLKRIKKEWLNLLSPLQEILRDYNLALRLKVLSSIPWRVWGEKKRHRTCLQIIESIYYCIERAAEVFKKYKNQIKGVDEHSFISTLRSARVIEEVFSIPPSIKQNKKLLSEYLSIALAAFEGYQSLIDLKIKPREAIFLIPRAVKIDILQEYDLYNLLTGYYPLRLCPTAEEEMRRNTLKEAAQIKNALSEKGLGFLNKFIGPKCQIVGFCPEEKSCPMILSSVKNYNEKFHQEMKTELKRQFEKNFKNLG